MLEEEFFNTIWHHGNKVRLNNGKEYDVINFMPKQKGLYLYSEEFDSRFLAHHAWIDCRTDERRVPRPPKPEKKVEEPKPEPKPKRQRIRVKVREHVAVRY